MSKHAAPLLILTLLGVYFLYVPLLSNAANRTIIVPDDYPTVRDAIGNATAGDTILVKKGTYDEGETLEIDKTLALTGEDVTNTIITLHPLYTETWILSAVYFTFSNAITITANDVKLSNLTITIANPGGYIAATGDRTQITGNTINTGGESCTLLTGSYCNVTDNVSGASISVRGSHNIVARNSIYSITVIGDINEISNNTVSGEGVILSDANSNVICGNIISLELGDYGVYIAKNSSHNIIHDNNISALLNDVKINSDSAESNTFYHDNFLKQYGEIASLYIGGVSFVNFWDNGSEGNYWEGYNGTDADRNGVGDTPYIIDGSNVDNYPLMFPFDIENNSRVLPPPEPFPTTLVVASVIVIAVVVTCLVIYKKFHSDKSPRGR
jgi:nitrous oxidase accessory protein